MKLCNNEDCTQAYKWSLRRSKPPRHSTIDLTFNLTFNLMIDTQRRLVECCVWESESSNNNKFYQRPSPTNDLARPTTNDPINDPTKKVNFSTKSLSRVVVYHWTSYCCCDSELRHSSGWYEQHEIRRYPTTWLKDSIPTGSTRAVSDLRIILVGWKALEHTDLILSIPDLQSKFPLVFPILLRHPVQFN